MALRTEPRVNQGEVIGSETVSSHGRKDEHFAPVAQIQKFCESQSPRKDLWHTGYKELFPNNV